MFAYIPTFSAYLPRALTKVQKTIEFISTKPALRREKEDKEAVICK